MRKYLFTAFITTIAITLISWGGVGHKTVATIAYNHLTPNAKTAVKALLGDTTMADVASWADEVRSKPQYKYTTVRHYVDLPLGLSYKVFADTVTMQPADNVYKAVVQCEKDLASKTTSKEQKAVALKFLIHFVGDLHQPMHVSRAEDQGGNTIQLQYNGKGTNLHSLWDGKLIGTEGKTFEQMSVDYDTATDKQIKQWQSDPLLNWLWESYQITTKLYAEIDQNNKVGEDYYKSHINIVHDRIEMGGIRLAGILNGIFKSSSYNFPSSPQATPSMTNFGPQTSEAYKTIAVEDAAKHIGENVGITAKVYSFKELGNMTLVNLGAEYPNQLLTVVLKGEATVLHKDINGKTIVVKGKLELYKEKPEIVVNDSKLVEISQPGQIKVDKSGKSGG